MAGKEVLEPQVCVEVTLCSCDPVVVEHAVASQDQRLRLALPFQYFKVETPQIPFGMRDVRRIGVQALYSQSRPLGRTVARVVQIPLRRGSFGRVNRLHEELVKLRVRLGTGRSG